MHGIGNDFVVLDARLPQGYHAETQSVRNELALAMCDRRFGIGADGLIFVEKGELTPIRMRMLNPDGSESEMCGNGLRCVARFLSEGPGAVDIETGGRVARCEVRDDETVRVNMGFARIMNLNLHVQGLTGVTVDVGNPHFVVFTDDVAAVDLEQIGPLLEHDPSFPHRSNIHFAQVLDANSVQQRTWERGAGVTLACGSGACAGAAAAVATGRTGSEVTIHLPGGNLFVEIAESGEAWMTGPAETAFTGVWAWPS